MKKLNQKIYDWLHENRDVSDEAAVHKLTQLGYKNGRNNPISLQNVRAWRKRIEPNGHAIKRSQMSKRDITRFEFAQIWNSNQYRTPYDLEIALHSTWASIQARARRYTEYREKHPEMHAVLPPLLWRKKVEGGLILLDPELSAKLKPWAFNKEKEVRKAPGVAVSSPQKGALMNKHLWNSLMHYEDYTGIIVLGNPIWYGKDKEESMFPEELKGRLLFDDLPLQNGSINISTSRFRPTLMEILTNSVCRMGDQASQIFAAPRFELKYMPRVNHDHPKAVSTCGALSYPHYRVNKLGQQDRTGEIAASNHGYGAVVIEKDGSDAFHMRHLMSGKRGEFYDIDVLYGGARLFTRNGHEHRPDDVLALIVGDDHVGMTDPEVFRATFVGKKSMYQVLKPDHIVLNDLMDGYSINHHDENNAVMRAYKALKGTGNLRKEIDEVVERLEWLLANTEAKIHILPSNHNEFVLKWINSNLFNEGVSENTSTGVEMFSQSLEEMQRQDKPKHEARVPDPVNQYLKYRLRNNPHYHRFITHERHEIFMLPDNLPPREEKKKNVILHGDVGIDGQRVRGAKSFFKYNQRVMKGHSHSPEISGPVVGVGTSTYRSVHYGSDISNWMNTHGLIFKNGQRMLINIVNGKWHGQRRKAK